MKIVFFEVEEWEKEHLEKEIAEENLSGDVFFIEDKVSKENLSDYQDAEILSVFTDSLINKEVLDLLPKLKLIATRSTGYDHISLKECAKRNTLVVNAPNYGENTVAEHTFALLLTLSRKIYQSYDRIRETGSFSLKGLQGFDLKGKTLGVVGVGSIGRNVVKIAKGFGMNVVAFDVKPDHEFSKKLDFKYKSLDEVLSQSDIVTLHIPYTESTHHLLNYENIKKMKKDSYLLNTSRGAVVETEALVRALKEGYIAGAGLDVLEEEGVIKDELNFITSGHPKESDLRALMSNHILIDMPNVIVTPHNAFNAKEAMKRILDTTVKNIDKFIKGKSQNIINE